MNGNSATLIQTPTLHAYRDALRRRLIVAVTPAYRGLLYGVGRLLIDAGAKLVHKAKGRS